MLDSTDRHIVQLLQADGRRSNVDIARELGLSESTVRKRLERMVAGGEIHISAHIEPSEVGYGVRALIMLTAELSQVDGISHVLREMPEVVSLFWLAGSFDLAIWAVFTDDDHLHDFLANRISKLPGVVRSETAHILAVPKYMYEWQVPDPDVKYILVVDDDPDFCESTRLVLTAQGYKVRTASTGREAIRSAIANPPALVIMDVMMEGVLDGWDASGRIRGVSGLHETPILVVSSITSSEYASLFSTDDDHLIDNFLSKPVSPDHLLQEVKRLIARYS